VHKVEREKVKEKERGRVAHSIREESLIKM